MFILACLPQIYFHASLYMKVWKPCLETTLKVKTHFGFGMITNTNIKMLQHLCISVLNVQCKNAALTMNGSSIKKDGHFRQMNNYIVRSYRDVIV